MAAPVGTPVIRKRQSVRSLGVVWACSVLLVSLHAGPTRAGEAPELEDRLADLGEHPRLFFDADAAKEVRARIDSHPLLKRAYRRMVEETQAIFDAAPVEREKRGKRLLGKSRKCLKRVIRLAFLYRMTGESRYAERAKKEMLAAAAFKDWNPSHFLDVAEMTAALAIGYDWLHAMLDSEARRTIRRAIVEKGLKPGLDGGWWVDTTNNWGQVCHGGLTVGALAVREHAPELARRTIRRALEKIGGPMGVYGPRGGYPEGPGYWRYGTSYNVLLIDALRSAVGSDFGLTSRSGFMRSAEYYLHAHGATGLYFNYSDGGAHAGLTCCVFWFARQREKPSLLWMERRKLERYAEGKDGASRFLPFLFVWAPSMEDIRPPKSRHRHVEGKTPVGIHRSAWEEDAVYVGLKAGTPRMNHAHMDIGSFVMEADGVRWAVDLGSQNYHSLESAGVDLWSSGQDAERWDVFRLSNFSHNTLVVDGKKQRVDGVGEIVGFSAESPRPHTVVDMSSVYAGQLDRVKRGVVMGPSGTVVVQDAVRARQSQPATVRWAMVTRADVQMDGDGRATLRQDGETLSLRVASPSAADLETYSTEPPADYDAPNPDTRMVGFKVTVDAGERQRLRVRLVPGSATEESSDIPASFADW